MFPEVEIITVMPDNRKFVTLFKVRESIDPNLLKGVLHLRKPGDPFIRIVEEIQDAKWTDISTESPM